MLLGGDEIGRTQHGNNNAYCQDNEITWFDWEHADAGLLAFAQGLIALRQHHPVFRRRRWFMGRQIHGEQVTDIAWFAPDGSEMDDEQLGRELRPSHRDVPHRRRPGRRPPRPADHRLAFLLMLNAADEPVELHAARRAVGASAGRSSSTPTSRTCRASTPVVAGHGRAARGGPHQRRGRGRGQQPVAGDDVYRAGQRVPADGALGRRIRACQLSGRERRGSAPESSRRPVRVPRATYRLQLQPGFGFDDAAAIADYLAALGVSHVYSSPYLQAAPRQHARLRRRRSTARQRRARRRRSRISASAPRSATTAWARCSTSCPTTWRSAAPRTRGGGTCSRTGRRAATRAIFDVEWDSVDPASRDTVLLPVLGDHYGRVLEARRAVAWSAIAAHFVGALRRPPLPRRAPLARAAARRRAAAPLARTSSSSSASRSARWRRLRRRSRRAAAPRTAPRRCSSSSSGGCWATGPRLAAAVDAQVERLNADVDRLDELLQAQNYRLAFWRAAREDLDYRRFFDVTLAGRPAHRGRARLRRHARARARLAARRHARRRAHRPPRRAARPEDVLRPPARRRSRRLDRRREDPRARRGAARATGRSRARPATTS